MLGPRPSQAPRLQPTPEKLRQWVVLNDLAEGVVADVLVDRLLPGQQQLLLIIRAFVVLVWGLRRTKHQSRCQVAHDAKGHEAECQHHVNKLSVQVHMY